MCNSYLRYFTLGYILIFTYFFVTNLISDVLYTYYHNTTYVVLCTSKLCTF
jgi:hypothetical protein